MIHIVRERATPEQIAAMMDTLRTYVKLAVDVRRGILAGGGEMHADCESSLLEDGSRQADVWGADWNPEIHEVEFQFLINIRPGQDNPSMKVLDPALQAKIRKIVERLMGKP